MIKNNFHFFILITLLTGCDPKPDIRFLEPQPESKRDLNVFPKSYQGQYLSKSDSSVLTIDSNMIFQEWKWITKVSNIEMQEELDTIYAEDIDIEIGDNWKMTIDVEVDSATIITYGIDTLFVLNDKTKLRKFKGYLFLNYSRPDATWRVRLLKFEHNQLEFKDLVNHSEIDSLRALTPIVTEIDTTNRLEHYDLNPGRKELKEILKRKESDLKFIKID